MALRPMSSLLSAKLTEQEDVSRLLGYRLHRVGSTCFFLNHSSPHATMGKYDCSGYLRCL